MKRQLEGDLFTGRAIGETLDYLTFEVTTRTPIWLIGTDLSSTVFLAVAEVFGVDKQFDAVIPNYRLFDTGTVAIPELTLSLDPGLYVVQVAVEEFRGGDLADTFIPVSQTPAIVSTAPYRFALEGEVRGLEFLEGNRDRSFTVTQVPEPSIAALFLTVVVAGVFRRKRRPDLPLLQ